MKARSPILKGFGKLSYAVCKFTGQQYLKILCYGYNLTTKKDKNL